MQQIPENYFIAIDLVQAFKEIRTDQNKWGYWFVIDRNTWYFSVNTGRGTYVLVPQHDIPPLDLLYTHSEISIKITRDI